VQIDAVSHGAEPVASDGKSVKTFSDPKRFLTHFLRFDTFPEIFLKTIIRERYPMAMQRPSGAGKRMLSPVVLGFLWAFAVPADARAQQFDTSVCTVQSVTRNGATTWQIKGTSTVTGLIADPKSTINVKAKIVFQKKAKGAADWSDMFDVTVTTTADSGTAKIDTDFQNFTPAPAAGDQYRISLSGTWRNPGPPAKNGALPATDSPAITPPVP
jgi:hypothetical protein